MDDRLIALSLKAARAIIADAIVGRDAGDIVLGDITLRPHQREAARRIEALLARRGGALLADRVGMGKTFVALTLARGRNALVVCPAAIRSMWEQAMKATGVAAPIVTHESLSRASAPCAEPDLVIVDEAHHARNPATARYRRLAALCARPKVVLLSGTPVHNHHRDLCALLALFLGTRAWTLADAELLECVIRRETVTSADETAKTPIIDAVRMLRPPEDELRPGELLALPEPVPARDGGTAGALMSLALVHRWASSRAALVGMLRRRLARATALAAALESGRHLTRRELARWVVDTDAVQLGFAELLAQPAIVEPAPLLEAVRGHVAALRDMLARCSATSDTDDARAELLRGARRHHAGERIIAFTQFAETAMAYWRRLRGDANTAMLASAGGRTAGGPLTRAEILRRFAPRAQGAPEPPRRERIDFLITTDLLSEGLNLQDASVVIHLDDPWTPARLEQRVGRVARAGSPHQRVTVYSMAPPVAAETVTRIRSRLQEKLRQAGRSVGLAGSIISPLRGAGRAPQMSPALMEQTVRTVVARWRGDAALPADYVIPGGIGVAHARGAHDGWIALLRAGDRCRLVARWHDEISAAAATVLPACTAISRATPADVNPAAVMSVMRELREWLAHRDAEACIDIRLAAERRDRRRMLARIGEITERVPFHRRAAIAALASAARQAASAPYAVGAQQVLDQIARAPMDDEAWLRSLVAFGAANARNAATSGEAVSEHIVAVIVVSPGPPAPDGP